MNEYSRKYTEFTAHIRALGDLPKETHKDVIQAIKEAYNKGLKDGSRTHDDMGILIR